MRSVSYDANAYLSVLLQASALLEVQLQDKGVDMSQIWCPGDEKITVSSDGILSVIAEIQEDHTGYNFDSSLSHLKNCPSNEE